MDHSSKETTSMGRSMELVLSVGLMETIMKESGLMTKFKARENSVLAERSSKALTHLKRSLIT
jgi:hypothetical protein